MKRSAFLILLTLCMLAAFACPSASSGKESTETESVKIVLFYGQGCPHCARMTSFISNLADEYPVEVERFEVYFNKSNMELFKKTASAYNIKIEGVPTVFIGDSSFAGYSQSIADSIKSKIEYCIKEKCPNPLSFASSVAEKDRNTGINTSESIKGSAKGIFIFFGLIILLAILILISLRRRKK